MPVNRSKMEGWANNSRKRKEANQGDLTRVLWLPAREGNREPQPQRPRFAERRDPRRSARAPDGARSERVFLEPLAVLGLDIPGHPRSFPLEVSISCKGSPRAMP